MERVVIKDRKFSITNDGNYLLSCLDNNEIVIDIISNKNINLLIDNLSNGNNLTINLGKDSVCACSFISQNNLDNVLVNFKLLSNAKADIYFADFSKGKENIKINIELMEEGTDAYWRLASLAGDNDYKSFDVSCIHHASNTKGKVDNYGVSKGEGKLSFAGVSHIIKGAKNSQTNQNAKIMVFDKLSNAVAKPILKIDENDVMASHAAIVGKINDEHLFYLVSRGISEEDAKRIITFGYLKPILNGFVNEEELQEQIIKLIEA